MKLGVLYCDSGTNKVFQKKGRVMQIEKALINDRLSISKVP